MKLKHKARGSFRTFDYINNMNEENNKLSICGRITRHLLFKCCAQGVSGKALALGFLLNATLFLHLGIKQGSEVNVLFAGASFFFATVWFFKSGCGELLKKGHIKNPNWSKEIELYNNSDPDHERAKLYKDLCGKCKCFSRSGFMDRFKGNCLHRNITVYKTQGCSDFQEK